MACSREMGWDNVQASIILILAIRNGEKDHMN